jgi:hypothetical protein
MLEKTNIQSRGFHNIKENGKIVGFQVRYRSAYYRGLWLSLSNGFELAVDGEKFGRGKIKVTVGGKTYTQDEMTKLGDVIWPNYEAAILTVDKPGGLKPGVHEVQVTFRHRISYMAPGYGGNEAGAAAPPAPPSGVTPPMAGAFGGGISARKLVLVY